MTSQKFNTQTAAEDVKLGENYAHATQAFLEGGVDELFDFVGNNPRLKTEFSELAKDMLREALRRQHADALAYQSIVRLAADAGVPLFNPLPTYLKGTK